MKLTDLEAYEILEPVSYTHLDVYKRQAFKEALESEVPVLIDCIINCDDKVWPMVAPGEAISSSFRCV